MTQRFTRNEASMDFALMKDACTSSNPPNHCKDFQIHYYPTHSKVLCSTFRRSVGDQVFVARIPNVTPASNNIDIKPHTLGLQIDFGALQYRWFLKQGDASRDWFLGVLIVSAFDEFEDVVVANLEWIDDEDVSWMNFDVLDSLRQYAEV